MNDSQDLKHEYVCSLFLKTICNFYVYYYYVCMIGVGGTEGATSPMQESKQNFVELMRPFISAQVLGAEQRVKSILSRIFTC